MVAGVDVCKMGDVNAEPLLLSGANCTFFIKDARSGSAGAQDVRLTRSLGLDKQQQAQRALRAESARSSSFYAFLSEARAIAKAEMSPMRATNNCMHTSLRAKEYASDLSCFAPVHLDIEYVW